MRMVDVVADDCKVPDWVVSKLGGVVTIKNAFEDVDRIWPARSVALLVSIQSGNPKPFVTCVMLGDKTEAEENFDFDEIEP